MTISRPTTRRPYIRASEGSAVKSHDHIPLSPKLTQPDKSREVESATALDLVARYPDLSGVELARLIDLYRRLSAVDIALMLSDQKLGPKLQRFANDQKRAIKAPLRDYAFLLVFAVIGLAVIAWAIVSGNM